MDEIVAELGAIVGRRHVVVDPDRVAGHLTDWTGRFTGQSPAVVYPADTDEVAAVVSWCRSSGVGLVPQGGNTSLVAGAVPRGQIVVSTRRLDAIGPVDAAAGQVTAGAGVTLTRVQTAASAAGWRYGVDFAARDSATVGGMIATNAGGMRVIRHGMTRRQVLGVEAVLGTGEVVARLDGLVKDNTGYDLAGLLCGSEGTLGVVTRARLALVPAAGATVTALVGCASMADAVSLAAGLRRRVPTLEAVEVVLASGARLVADLTDASPVFESLPPVLVLVEAVGPPDPAHDVAEVVAEAAGVTEVAVATDAVRAGALWAVRERHTDCIARLGLVHKFDVTVPAAGLAGFVEEIDGLVTTASPDARVWVFGHLGDGNLHVNVTDVPADRAMAVADAVLGRVVDDGGSISAEHGIGTLKREWFERSRGAGDVQAMRAIAAALDPDGICNPGVLL